MMDKLYNLNEKVSIIIKLAAYITKAMIIILAAITATKIATALAVET